MKGGNERGWRLQCAASPCPTPSRLPPWLRLPRPPPSLPAPSDVVAAASVHAGSQETTGERNRWAPLKSVSFFPPTLSSLSPNLCVCVCVHSIGRRLWPILRIRLYVLCNSQEIIRRGLFLLPRQVVPLPPCRLRRFLAPRGSVKWALLLQGCL